MGARCLTPGNAFKVAAASYHAAAFSAPIIVVIDTI